MTVTNGKISGSTAAISNSGCGLAACGIRFAENSRLETIGSKPMDMVDCLNSPDGLQRVFVGGEGFFKRPAVFVRQSRSMLPKDLLHDCGFGSLLPRGLDDGNNFRFQQDVQDPEFTPVAVQKHFRVANTQVRK